MSLPSSSFGPTSHRSLQRESFIQWHTWYISYINKSWLPSYCYHLCLLFCAKMSCILHVSSKSCLRLIQYVSLYFKYICLLCTGFGRTFTSTRFPPVTCTLAQVLQRYTCISTGTLAQVLQRYTCISTGTLAQVLQRYTCTLAQVLQRYTCSSTG